MNFKNKINKPCSTRLLRVIFSTILFMAVYGCTSIEGYLKSQITEEVSSGKTLLFFQFREKNRLEDPDTWHSNEDYMDVPIWSVTNIKTGEIFTNKFLMDRSRPPPRNDVGYVVVPAGEYFLKLVAPSPYGLTWEWDSNRYLITIPENSSVLFGGIFTAICSHKSSIAQLFVKSVDQCEETLEYSYQEDSRLSFIREWSAEYGNMEKVVPRILNQSSPDELKAATFSTHTEILIPGEPVLLFEWNTFDNVTTPNYQDYIPSPFRLPGSGLGSSGGGYGPGAVGILALYAIAGLSWWAGSEMEANAEAKEWMPCFKKFTNPKDRNQFVNQVNNQWHENNPYLPNSDLTAAESMNTLLLDFNRIAFRKCSAKETVCLEIALHTALTNKGSTFFDRYYVYTAEEFSAARNEANRKLPAHLWWETQIEEYPEPRHINEYCDAENENLLESDIQRGVSALVEQLKTDLRRDISF